LEKQESLKQLLLLQQQQQRERDDAGGDDLVGLTADGSLDDVLTVIEKDG